MTLSDVQAAFKERGIRQEGVVMQQGRVETCPCFLFTTSSVS